MPPTIRLADGQDAEQVLAIYAPSCDTPVSFEAHAPSVEGMRGRIAGVTAKLPWLVCEDGREVWGYVYAKTYRERVAYQWSVEVSAYVAAGRQRRGVGRGL